MINFLNNSKLDFDSKLTKNKMNRDTPNNIHNGMSILIVSVM